MSRNNLHSMLVQSFWLNRLFTLKISDSIYKIEPAKNLCNGMTDVLLVLSYRSRIRGISFRPQARRMPGVSSIIVFPSFLKRGEGRFLLCHFPAAKPGATRKTLSYRRRDCVATAVCHCESRLVGMWQSNIFKSSWDCFAHNICSQRHRDTVSHAATPGACRGNPEKRCHSRAGGNLEIKILPYKLMSNVKIKDLTPIDPDAAPMPDDRRRYHAWSCLAEFSFGV